MMGLGTALGLAACSATPRPVPDAATPGIVTDGYFTMADGARLPYRRWLPAVAPGTDPWLVILALHGFNDSRDAWEIPAPYFQRAGIAIYAPDQRGFGAAPDRGLWPGEPVMVDDIVQMARMMRQRYPRARLVLMGESMGGALLMRAATRPLPPPADAYVLCAPAVWSRAQMGILLSSGLWLVSGIAPWWRVTGEEVPIRVEASDNRAALLRLAHDPLTIIATRFDVVRGLTNTMDAAQASAPDFTAPGLFLYGGKDDLVPAEATAAMWRKLPASARCAFYPAGYHLLLRDHDRAAPIGDIIAWLHDPATWLPSGADVAAGAWLTTQG